MTPTDDKVKENRYRRQAKRLGLWLKKSRVQKTHIDDWGGYMILDPYRNTIEHGARFDLTLNMVGEYLDKRERDLDVKQRR